MIPSDTKISELVTLKDDVTIPQLVIHVRSQIIVGVEPLTTPGMFLPDLVHPQFLMVGHETIGDVKKIVFEHIQQQDVWNSSVRLEDCQLHYDGDCLSGTWSQISEDMSLHNVCLHEGDYSYGKFDPIAERPFFALTINKKEAFIVSRGFDNTVIAIICANIIFLAMDHYNASEGFKAMMRVAELVFNILYTIEIFVKVYCMSNAGQGFDDVPDSMTWCWRLGYYFHKGWSNYWRFPSNKFDFVICFISWFSIFTDSIGIDLSFVKAFRVVRVLRVIRLVRKLDSVRKILDATSGAFRPCGNIM